MKKFAGNLITFLCALGILWILVSWADVIAHNTTYQQEEQYMKNNAFVDFLLMRRKQLTIEIIQHIAFYNLFHQTSPSLLYTKKEELSSVFS